MSNDKQLSRQLRGFFTPPHDPTAQQGMRTLVETTATTTRRKVVRTFHVPTAEMEPRETPGLLPKDLVEANEWYEKLMAERAAVVSHVTQGQMAPPWVTQRLTQLKPRKRELGIARAKLADPNYVAGPTRPRVTTEDRTRQLAEILGEEVNPESLVAALNTTLREVLDVIEARGVDAKEILSDTHRAVLGYTIRWLHHQGRE